MAGKHIYIEKILDSLLSGIDTVLEGMETKLQAVVDQIKSMMGGEDPEDQKSLSDVVNAVGDMMGEGEDKSSLYDVVGELNTMTGRLDEQISELQNLVAASSSAVTKIIAKASDRVGEDGFYLDYHYPEPLNDDNEINAYDYFNKTDNFKLLSKIDGFINIKVGGVLTVTNGAGAFTDIVYTLKDASNTTVWTHTLNIVHTNAPGTIEHEFDETYLTQLNLDETYTLKIELKSSPWKNTEVIDYHYGVISFGYDIIDLISDGGVIITKV